MIKETAVQFSIGRIGDGRTGKSFHRDRLVDLGAVVPRMRAGLAVPGADQIPVAPKTDQGVRRGLDAISGGQRQAAAGGAAQDGDLRNVGVESSGALFADPFEGVLKVFDDARQLSLRGESVVDRYKGVAGAQHVLLDATADSLTAAIDQRAAVDPHHDLPLEIVVGAMDVEFDFEISNVLVGEGLFPDFRGLGHGGNCGKRKREAADQKKPIGETESKGHHGGTVTDFTRRDRQKAERVFGLMLNEDAGYEIVRTRRGVRLEQNGAALSELLSKVGPTDSVFDVLAAAAHAVAPNRDLALLGFAGGGMIAPLRAMGGNQAVDAVDLDAHGYALFREYASEYEGEVRFHHDDAVLWLRQGTDELGVIIDDLSVPTEDDVVKPAISREVLPELIKRRLARDGVVITNVLSEPELTWEDVLAPAVAGFARAHVIELEEFNNRIVVAGNYEHDARSLSRDVRRALREIGSSQAEVMRVRTARVEE